jgi:hypothetical protein
MTPDIALLRSVLARTASLPASLLAGPAAVVLVLAAVFVALLLSVLIPMLSEPALSPTRWYPLAV